MDRDAYETISWTLDDDGVATLTLDRPDALNSFTVTMARELEQFFRTDATRRRGQGRRRHRRRPGVLRRHGPLGRGQRLRARRGRSPRRPATCATTSPRSPYTVRRARHRRQGDARDPRAAQAGDRRDQRPGRRHRRHDDAGDGHPDGLDQGPHRLRLRPARHRARRPRRPGSCRASSGIQQALEWVYSAEILTAEQALAGRLVRSVHEPDELLAAALELARSLRRTPLAGRARPGQAAALPQRRRRPPDRGAPGRQPGDVARQHRRRQGGRGRLPGEARPRVHRQGERAAPRSTDRAQQHAPAVSHLRDSSQGRMYQAVRDRLMGRCADHVRATHRDAVGVGDLRAASSSAGAAGEPRALDDLVRLLSPMLWQVVRASGLDRGRRRGRRPDHLADAGALRRLDRRAPRRRRLAVHHRTPRGLAGLQAVRRASSPSRTRRSRAGSPTSRHPRARSSSTTTTPGCGPAWASCPSAASGCCASWPPRPAPTTPRSPPSSDMPVGSIGPTRGRCLDKLRRELAQAGGDLMSRPTTPGAPVSPTTPPCSPRSPTALAAGRPTSGRPGRRRARRGSPPRTSSSTC